MSEIVARAPEALELQDATTAELHDRLGTAIGMTETAIRAVATIWRELVRRGEDMSRHRFSLARFMLPVADGRLLPGLVVQMSGQQRALDRVAELTLEDQEAVLSGRPITVYRGDGKTHAAPIADLTYSEIVLAIRDGRIREVDEQRLPHERSRRSKEAPRRGRPMSIAITGAGTMMRIGKAEIEVERVIAALRAAGLIQAAP